MAKYVANVNGIDGKAVVVEADSQQQASEQLNEKYGKRKLTVSSTDLEIKMWFFRKGEIFKIVNICYLIDANYGFLTFKDKPLQIRFNGLIVVSEACMLQDIEWDARKAWYGEYP